MRVCTAALCAIFTNCLNSSATTQFSLSTGARSHLQLAQQAELIAFYKVHRPDLHLIPRTYPNPPEGATFISSSVTFHDHVILHGRRITTSSFNGAAGNSIIQYQLNGQRFVGEIASILTHIQPPKNGQPLNEHLLVVKWLVHDPTYDTSPWDP